MLQVSVRTREIPSPQQVVSQPTTPPAVKQFIPYPQQTQNVSSPVIISPQPPQTLNVSSSPEHGQIQIQNSPQQQIQLPVQQEMPVTPQHSSLLLDPNLQKTPQSNILLESPVQVS